MRKNDNIRRNERNKKNFYEKTKHTHTHIQGQTDADEPISFVNIS